MKSKAGLACFSGSGPTSALKTAFVRFMLFAKENRFRAEVTRQLLPDAK